MAVEQNGIRANYWTVERGIIAGNDMTFGVTQKNCLITAKNKSFHHQNLNFSIRLKE